MKQQPKNCFDLVIGSPPYAEKGERYIAGRQKWRTEDWVAWMMEVTAEAVRLSRHWVIWVVNGAVKDGHYLPACEGLVWELHKQGIVACERPCIWHKNAPPNRQDWFGNDWEHVLAFKKPGSKPHFDWQAIAKPPKYRNGGQFRQRTTTGERRLGSQYPQNKLARPRDVISPDLSELEVRQFLQEWIDESEGVGNLFRCTVGGGHLGSKLAHLNEAPFPEKLIEPFVLALCPRAGSVLDPFSGSGTTLAVAIRHGREATGVDYRESQVELGNRRVEEVPQAEEATFTQEFLEQN